MIKKLGLFFVTGLLLSGVMAPAASASTSARRKTSHTPVKQAPAQRQTVYGQGYQKGYADGFAQGHGDWSKGMTRDFQNSNAYQHRDQSIAPQFAKSEEYHQGYNLGFEFGYTDAYYGRARNNVVPGNAVVLAKAAALADAQRAANKPMHNELANKPMHNEPASKRLRRERTTKRRRGTTRATSVMIR